MEFSSSSLYFLLEGIVLGFSIAAPVGPIGILCIRKTLHYGRLSGLLSGLGAAVADTAYAIVAAFGLTFISNFLVAGQTWLHLLGGAFLFYLGWNIFFSETSKASANETHSSLLRDFVSTFFLTITNPMTIFSFLAIFAGLGLPQVDSSYLDALLIVLGVFLGSASWWFLLCAGVTFFREKVSHTMLLWINRAAGGILMGLAIVALLFSKL